MNPAIINILLWENFRRTLPIVAFALAVGIVSSYASQRFLGEFSTSTETAVIAIFFTLVLGGTGLMYAFNSTGHLASNISRMTLLLPAHTATVVCARFLFNLAAIALIAAVTVAFQSIALGLPISVGTTVCWTIAIFSIIQFVGLAVGEIGDWSFAVSFTVLILMLWYVSAISEWSVDRGFEPLRSGIVLAIACPTVSLIASWWVVRAQRQGRFEFSWWEGRPGTASQVTALAPFKSPRAAQRWFERRRTRAYLPVFSGIIIVTITLSILLPDYRGRIAGAQIEGTGQIMSVLARDLTFVALYGIALAAFIVGGILFFRNYRLQSEVRRSFLFLRPASTRNLAQARLLAIARSVGITFAFFAVFALVSLIVQVNNDLVTEYTYKIEQHGWASLLTFSALAVMGMAVVVWAVLWIENIFFAFALGTAYLGVVDLVLGRGPSPAHDNAYWIGAILATVLVAALLYQTRRRDLMSRSTFAATLLAFPLLAGVTFMFDNWQAIVWSGDYYDIGWSITVLTLPLLAALPIATVPLTMHWARHR